MNKESKSCKVEGCTNPYSCKGYCKLHYMRMKRNGKPEVLAKEERKPRGKNKKKPFVHKNVINKWFVHEDYAELEVTSKRDHTARFIIDLDVYEEVKDYKWMFASHEGSRFYCKNRTLGLLHRHVVGLPIKKEGDIVCDHINGNTLDCRRQNLRICTIAENNMNMSVRRDNPVGVRGISWNKQHQKYKVELQFKKKRMFFGMYKNLDDAIEARKRAEQEYACEFSPWMSRGENCE